MFQIIIIRIINATTLLDNKEYYDETSMLRFSMLKRFFYVKNVTALINHNL